MKILVVGAGIAGSGIAHMLARDGHDVRVVDKVAEPYAGGYQILFDDVAQLILSHIGATQVVADLSTPTADVMVFHGKKRRATIPMKGSFSARRGDLVAAIAQHVAKTVPMRFGIELMGIEHDRNVVNARFSDGTTEQYDLLIGADGLYSTVRRLAVEVDRSYLYENGRHNLWVDVPGRIDATRKAAILFGTGIGAQVFPYTHSDETLVLTSINLGRLRPAAADLLPVAAELLENAGETFAPFVPCVRNAPDENLRLTRFAQVRAPRWHAWNVVLIGDAAHCIDPLSGAGAHGGLLGAAVFTEELRRAPHDIAGAATRYRKRLLPYVRSAQFLTAGLMENATSEKTRERLRASKSILKSALSLRRKDIPSDIART